MFQKSYFGKVRTVTTKITPSQYVGLENHVLRDIKTSFTSKILFPSLHDLKKNLKELIKHSIIQIVQKTFIKAFNPLMRGMEIRKREFVKAILGFKNR